MKSLAYFLNENSKKNKKINKEDIFIVFKKIIKEEFGKKGAENIYPVFFKNKIIFFKTGNSNWSNEVLLNKNYLIKKINDFFGDKKEVVDIKYGKK